MTDTERITHAVYDRHAGMTPEAENLGRIAAECELMAAHPDTEDWQRPQLLANARDYRDAQTVEMIRAMRVNPYSKLDDWNLVHRAELEDQAQAIEPYSLANVLGPWASWCWHRLNFYYGLFAIAAILAILILL